MRLTQTLLVLFVFVCTGLHAQIFINTGNPNMDKYKEENPNAIIYQGTSPTDSAKVQTSVKTPAIKIKQPTESVTTKKSVETVTTKKTEVVTTKKTTEPVATKKQPEPVVAKKQPESTTPKKTVEKPAPAPEKKPEGISPNAQSVEFKQATAGPKYDGSLTDANNNLPPNAEIGKCYARCFVADQFEFKEETVVDKPETFRTKTIPAIYRTVFDTVVTKPATVRFEDIPAVYETVMEDIMVSPATQKWVKASVDPGCLSSNPADCQIMCLKEVPAIYKKVARRVLKTPAFRQEIPVSAEYKVVSRRVVDQPAREEQIEIPATYKKVISKNLIRKGGYSEWKEILCGDKLTTAKIIEIQKALKANGYDPGKMDDVFGALTKAALIKYQTDKNLPIGNLNMETLRSLGVETE